MHSIPFLLIRMRMEWLSIHLNWWEIMLHHLPGLWTLFLYAFWSKRIIYPLNISAIIEVKDTGLIAEERSRIRQSRNDRTVRFWTTHTKMNVIAVTDRVYILLKKVWYWREKHMETNGLKNIEGKHCSIADYRMCTKLEALKLCGVPSLRFYTLQMESIAWVSHRSIWFYKVWWYLCIGLRNISTLVPKVKYGGKSSPMLFSLPRITILRLRIMESRKHAELDSKNDAEDFLCAR